MMKEHKDLTVKVIARAKKVMREELNSLIDRAADLIRMIVDYKFILVLLFLKRLDNCGNARESRMSARYISKGGEQ